MNRKQSKSTAVQHQARRASDEDKTRPPFWVVRFRIGRDNKRREIVYRTVTPFWSEYAAGCAMSDTPEGGCCVLVYADGHDSHGAGDVSLVERWRTQSKRRSLNHGRDPFTAGTYMERESASLSHREELDAEEELIG